MPDPQSLLGKHGRSDNMGSAKVRLGDSWEFKKKSQKTTSLLVILVVAVSWALQK